MTTTEQSQHMQALERANLVRLARAELKRSIGRGDVSVADVLDPDGEIPWEAEDMSVIQLLASQHRWGRRRSQKVLVRLGIGEQRHLGLLTPRQRRRIIERVGGAGADAPSLAA